MDRPQDTEHLPLAPRFGLDIDVQRFQCTFDGKRFSLAVYSEGIEMNDLKFHTPLRTYLNLLPPDVLNLLELFIKGGPNGYEHFETRRFLITLRSSRRLL